MSRFKDHQLGDVLDFHSNQRIPLSSLEREKRQGEYRYYGAQGVIDYLDDYIFDGEYVLIAEDGANLVTRNEPIAFLVKGQFWVNNHAHVVRGKDGLLDNYYLTMLLNSTSIAGYTTGAAQPKLSQGKMRQIVLSLPDYETQQRITSILSAYDDLIENNRRRIALLEESARLLYREWFVRLRFPGHEHTRIVNGVPDGWKCVPATEALEVNPRTKLSDEEEHWYVEMSDLPTDSMVIQNAVMRDGRSGSKFMNGDTLFARITPCLENGKTGFVNFMADGDAGRGSTEFIVLRSKLVTPEFVYCLARTYDFREHAIKNMVGSSGRQRVKESCFEKFMLMVPPRSLLDLFSDLTLPVFDQIKNLHRQNQKLRTARDLLLPKLMSGEIEL